MAGKFKTKWFWASWAKYNVDEGVLFKKKVEKEWQRWVDIGDYAQKLQDAYEQLDAEGYDVIRVVPISVGTCCGHTGRRDGRGNDLVAPRPERLEKRDRPSESRRSAGFAIRSPRGIGDPHDCAPQGAWLLSCVPIC